MPRYVVERKFPQGMPIRPDGAGAAAVAAVVGGNTPLGVTWLHSYVSEDKAQTYCVYDAPDAETVRTAAERNGLPVDKVTQVSVLDPYFSR